MFLQAVTGVKGMTHVPDAKPPSREQVQC